MENCCKDCMSMRLNYLLHPTFPISMVHLSAGRGKLDLNFQAVSAASVLLKCHLQSSASYQIESSPIYTHTQQRTPHRQDFQVETRLTQLMDHGSRALIVD